MTASSPSRTPLHDMTAASPYRTPLHDMSAFLNRNENTRRQTLFNLTKKPYKDEENDAIAELVTKCLQKIEDKKKNKLICTIMNILFE